MSADNWTKCPKCVAKARETLAKQHADLKSLYGKIDSEEFLSRRAALADPDEDPEVGETLREDYELGIDEDWQFSIRYSASCNICRFEFNHKHEQQIEGL